MRRVFRTIVAFLVATPFLLLFLAMVLGPPAMFVVETIDILRMRERAEGIVDAVSIEHGGKGTSRARIEYHFDVGGRRVTSDRYVPGYFGNSGSWTGGASIASDFPVGRQVTVYYSRRNPELCALEDGWFSWSVGPTLVWFGLAIVAWARLRLRPGAATDCLWCDGIASIAYGAGELFLGPSVVRVRDLGWHFLAWCGALAGAA